MRMICVTRNYRQAGTVEPITIFDAIGGSHFDRSFACLAPGGILIGYGSQTMAIGGESIIAAGLGLARLKLWGALSFLFRGRRALWYSITDRRMSHPDEFKADMAALFELLRNGAIHPVVIGREPLAAVQNIHARIDTGGLGGKIVLLPLNGTGRINECPLGRVLNVVSPRADN